MRRCLWALGLLCWPSYGRDLLGPPLKSYQIEIRGTRFETRGHFQEDAVKRPLESGEGFQLFEGELFFRHALTYHFKWDLALKVRQNQFTQNSETILKSGLERATVGGRYLFKARLFFIVPFLSIHHNNVFEFQENDYPLGDGGVDFVPGIGVSYPSTVGTLEASLGYKMKMNTHLSDEIPYHLKYSIPSKIFSLGIDGFLSVKNDQYLFYDDPGRPKLLGRTRLFNGFHREVMAPFAEAALTLGKWRLMARFTSVLRGKSTDEGHGISVSLQWTSETPSRDDRKKASFKEYTLEATVIKVHPNQLFVQIDKGSSQGIEKGMKFDLFKTDFFGGNDLVAEGIVYELAGPKAVLKIIRKIKKIKIQRGLTARGN